MDFYRANKIPMQLYDVNHASKSKDLELRKFNMDGNDWDVLEYSLCVLKPCSDFTNTIEGTKYPTSNLYIPLTCQMIRQLSPSKLLKKPWDNEPCLVTPSQKLKDQHQLLYDDMYERMVTKLSATTKAKFVISTMLDPRFKSWQFLKKC